MTHYINSLQALLKQKQTMQSRYNKRSNFDELRKNELTSRAGFGWEEGEEEKLLSMRLEKSSYDDIAGELKRTIRSIQTRLYQHICKQVECESMDEKEFQHKFGVSDEELSEFKKKRDEHQNKMASRKRNTRTSRDTSRPYIPYDTTRNASYDIRNELNVLRQEVRELRQEVRELNRS
tara:strand:+ start:6207 stop:6740 length:534 start_codon:yes stop_codon:yes gene_type:complete